MNIVLRGLLLSMCMLASAQAAPKQIELTYQATRNGQPFATVTETYQQENGRYKIESVTKGVGVYALFGKRILTSVGAVSAEGLKPERFELHQGDNEKKALFTDFDWTANQLTMKVKGEPTVVPLEKGAQDILSLMYQFMFARLSGDMYGLPVTTGKKLRDYKYQVTSRNEMLELPAGKFKTIHLVNADKEGDQKELWLAAESHYLPVRLLMRDDNEGVIEQTLTSVHAE